MRYYIKKVHACGHCPNFRSEFMETGPNERIVINVCDQTFNQIEYSSEIDSLCPLLEEKEFKDMVTKSLRDVCD